MDSLKADDIVHYYLLGQRQVLGITDQQLERGILDQAEEAIFEAVEVHEEIEPTLLHRYLSGELTEGMPPLERFAQREELFLSLEWFFTVLELLRMAADGPKATIPRTRVVGKRQRLQHGEYGPFVITQVAGEPKVLCWACRTEQPYDLIMALKELMCPDCGALAPREVSAEGMAEEETEATDESDPGRGSGAESD